MAYGCIPAATEMKSGIPQLIDPEVNGFIIKDRNWDNLVQYLRLLQTDDAQQKTMSLAARKKVAAEFTLEKMLDKFENLLLRVRKGSAEGSYRRPKVITYGSKFGDVLPPQKFYSVEYALKY